MSDVLAELRPPGGWHRPDPASLATECQRCHHTVRLRLVHIDTGTVDCPDAPVDAGEGEP